MDQEMCSEVEIDREFDTLIRQLSIGGLSSVAPLSKASPLAVYGMGGFGQKVCQILKAEGHEVIGCIDRRVTGVAEEGNIPVYPVTPESFALLKNQGVTTVVIGVFNGSVRLDEIVNLLAEEKVGFQRVVTPLELQELFPDHLGWRYWMTPRSWYSSRVQKLVDSVSLWADAESRRVYKETLLFRAGWQMSRLQTPDQKHQYFPPSLPRLGMLGSEGLQLVDGGAYNGDTLTAFVDQGIAIKAVYAFEPDLKNFAELQVCTRDTGLSGRALLWPCGLWSSTAVLHFQDNQGPSSRITMEPDAGSKAITVTSLDQALAGQSVNLIKLDIEGAEIEALRGARQTLCEHRPSLAICTYHYPEHLWEVAEQIHAFELNYKLFLRPHLYNTFELVLYGLPS